MICRFYQYQHVSSVSRISSVIKCERRSCRLGSVRMLHFIAGVLTGKFSVASNRFFADFSEGAFANAALLA